VVLRTGMEGLVLGAATITGTFILGALLARWLKISLHTSTLISAGTAICGGSAIAAVGAVIGAKAAEMSVAMGTVFLLNAIGLYIFPPLGHALGLTEVQFGTWAGVAIHDVSSVVGAASHYGATALQTATAVKLSRALWIVPVSLAAGWAFNRAATVSTAAPNDKEAVPGNTKLQLPWFIGFFILASVARSFIPGVPEIAPSLTTIARLGLTVTLYLIGASLSKETLRSVGLAPMLQGLLLWIFIASAALVAVLYGA